MRGCLAALLVLVGLVALLPGLCALSYPGGAAGLFQGGGLLAVAIGCVGIAFVLLFTRGPD